MARCSRSDVIDPNEINIVHTIGRTVRRCFLLGDDKVSGKNFDHRKQWIEDHLQHFAAHFAIDLLSYSILSNHLHQILRTRPDVVESWSDTEVARRWLMICPIRKVGGSPAEPNEAELNSIRNCPVKTAEIRERLSSVSWWMRLVNQRVAQRSNKEEGQKGRFWQDRFQAIRIVDEESLLACSVYVDLNPVRAAMAETIEASDFTSIQRRIDSFKQAASPQERRDAFLAKLCLEEANGEIGIVPSATGLRCSDKGFLAMDERSYIELLDWTARQKARGKRGTTPKEYPPVLERLGLCQENWLELVWAFEEAFIHIAGRSDRVDSIRSHVTRRRFRLRPLARRLLSPTT